MNTLYKMNSNKTVQFDDESQTIPSREGQETPGNDEASPWCRQNILSLDGGGIRGLSSLLMLKTLMDLISNEEQRLDSKSTSSSASPLFRDDVPNHLDMKYLPCHYFDYIAGTSTGGLIAIMLGRLRMTVDDCLNELDNFDHHLERPRPIITRIPRSLFSKDNRTWPLGNYQAAFDQRSSTACKSDLDPKKIKRISRSPESSSSPLSTDEKPPLYPDELVPSRCRTIVLCVQLKKGTGGPHAFRSYSLPRKHADMQFKQNMSAAMISIAQVAKAIITPPTSLKNFDLNKQPKYIDGSLYAQNPTLDVFYEVSSLHEKKSWSIEAIVSIGCDQAPRRTSSHGSTIIKALNRSTRGVDDKMKLIAAEKYYRFAWDGEFNEKPKRQSVREFLEPYAANYFAKYPNAIADLERVARKLVRIRRKRSETSEWGSFAFGLEYNCTLHPCGRRTFHDRQALLRHWIWDHGFEHPNPSTTEDFEKKFIKSKEYVRLT